MSRWWMDERMAKRFDPLFPASGGLTHLLEVRLSMSKRLEATKTKMGDTFFHPIEVQHINKILELLGDDDEAKSTLMSKLAFAQMKNDCAG